MKKTFVIPFNTEENRFELAKEIAEWLRNEGDDYEKYQIIIEAIKE